MRLDLSTGAQANVITSCNTAPKLELGVGSRLGGFLRLDRDDDWGCGGCHAEEDQ